MSRRPMSLSDLSAETIITNLNRYGDQISKQLSPPGRDMVLDKILSHSEACGGKKFANLWPNLHRLFSSATKSIDTKSLTNIVSNIDSNPNDQNLMLALEMIAIYAPGLTELLISSPKSRSYHLGPSEVSMICRMKHLTHLSFGTPFMAVNIKIDDLTTIVRECKNLQSINSYYCSKDDVAFLSEQNFPYQAIVTDQLFVPNSVTFAKILPPNLRGPYFCWSASLVDDKSVILLKDALTRHSNTNVKRDEVPGKVDLVMSKIKCVKFLCHPHSSPTLISFLKENGQNLDQLIVRVEPCYSREETYTITLNVTLDQLFNWCRNLSIFEMRSFKVTSFDVSPTALTRLRKFTWSCNSETQGFQISSILSAPLLEEVEIEDYQLEIGQNDDLLDRIEKREILQNLKKFDYYDLSAPPYSEHIDLLYALKCAIPKASVKHLMSYKWLAYKLLKKY